MRWRDWMLIMSRVWPQHFDCMACDQPMSLTCNPYENCSSYTSSLQYVQYKWRYQTPEISIMEKPGGQHWSNDLYETMTEDNFSVKERTGLSRSFWIVLGLNVGSFERLASLEIIIGDLVSSCYWSHWHPFSICFSSFSSSFFRLTSIIQNNDVQINFFLTQTS